MTSERAAMLRRLVKDAHAISRRFGLCGWTLEECDERQRARCKHRAPGGDDGLAFGLREREACMGCCFWYDDHFKVRVRLFNRRNGHLRAYHLVAETLCHELAHVATPDDTISRDLDPKGHGEEWQYAYDRIVGFARAEEIIEPPDYER